MASLPQAWPAVPADLPAGGVPTLPSRPTGAQTVSQCISTEETRQTSPQFQGPEAKQIRTNYDLVRLQRAEKMQEGVRRVTAKANGVVKQTIGTAQDLYGGARDSASEAAETALNTVASFERLFWSTIENATSYQCHCGTGFRLAVG